jgi:hypothetical protein
LVAPVVLLEIDCPLPEGNLTVSFWKPMTAVGRVLTMISLKFFKSEWPVLRGWILLPKSS